MSENEIFKEISEIFKNKTFQELKLWNWKSQISNQISETFIKKSQILITSSIFAVSIMSLSNTLLFIEAARYKMYTKMTPRSQKT